MWEKALEDFNRQVTESLQELPEKLEMGEPGDSRVEEKKEVEPPLVDAARDPYGLSQSGMLQGLSMFESLTQSSTSPFDTLLESPDEDLDTPDEDPRGSTPEELTEEASEMFFKLMEEKKKTI